MSDKYYGFSVDETTTRGKLEEVTGNVASVGKYEHGTIISNDLADNGQLFSLTFEENALKTYETYLNNFEVQTLDETLINYNGVLDYVLNIPRTLYITVSGYSFIGATNTNKIKLKIKGTTTKDGDTQQTYTIELSKSDDSFVGGTNEAFTTIHSVQITDVAEENATNFDGCKLTISSGDGVGFGYGTNVPYLYKYFYDGTLQDGLSGNDKTITIDTTNKKITFSDRANFTENNKKRKLYFVTN